MVELPDRASGSGNRLTPHVDFGLNGLGFLFRASGPKMGLTSSPWQEYGGLSAFRAKPVGVCHSLACCLVGHIVLATAVGLPPPNQPALRGPCPTCASTVSTWHHVGLDPHVPSTLLVRMSGPCPTAH